MGSVAVNTMRTAIVDLLEGDGTLMKLATGGVHFRMAPEGTKPPLVTFDQYVPDTATLAFAGPDLDGAQWLVTGIAVAAVAEDIDNRIRTLMRDAALPIGDGETLFCRRIGGVSYPELLDGDRYEHVGSIYRVLTERHE